MKKISAAVSMILALTLLFSSCKVKDNRESTTAPSTAKVNDIAKETETSSKTDETTTEKSTEKSETTAKKELNFRENYASEGKKIAALFDYKAVLEDISEIDLYQKRPDFSKFTKKTVRDSDGLSSIDKYYKGNTLVYEICSDFGERGYFQYTKTKSGKPVKVLYWDDIDCKKLEEIKMDSDGFSIIMRQLNKATPCGADEIYVSVIKNKTGDLPESADFEIMKQTVTLTQARYYSGKDYVNYYANQSDKGGLAESKSAMYSVCKSDLSTSVVKQIQSETSPLTLLTLVGTHKLSYKQNGSNKNWFITCDIYVCFSNKEDTESYVTKNGLEADKSVSIGSEHSAGNVWYVKYKNVTLGIADGFTAGSKSFNEFALDEFNDYSFANISINSNCQVTSLSYDNSILSYY